MTNHANLILFYFLSNYLLECELSYLSIFNILPLHGEYFIHYLSSALALQSLGRVHPIW